MHLIYAVLVLIFLVGYVIPNIFTYPWESLVLVVACIGVMLAADGGERLMAWLNASKHPAVRHSMAAYNKFYAIFSGAPPYNAARWWLARTLVQGVFWIVMLAVAFAVLFALGAVFEWIDPKNP